MHSRSVVFPIKIVVVEDHEILRVGVRDFLESFRGFAVVGEAAVARAAFRLVESAKPDVVVMDIALPGMDGVIATREILRRQPSTRIVILSAHDRLADVKDALNVGALAYARKSDPPDTLMSALKHVIRGARYLPPSLVARFPDVERMLRSADALGPLTEREREIFRMAADCYPASEIARQLCVARKTVDVHLNHINRKLGFRDRAELVRFASGLGLIHSIRTADRNSHRAHSAVRLSPALVP